MEFPVFITAHHPEMSLPHPSNNKVDHRDPHLLLWEEQSQIAFILTKRLILSLQA